MVKMDNVVRCYRGIDPLDGEDSLFAVKNGMVAPSICSGVDDQWLTIKGFGSFDEWSTTSDKYNTTICTMLDQFELLWEKQE